MWASLDPRQASAPSRLAPSRPSQAFYAEPSPYTLPLAPLPGMPGSQAGFQGPSALPPPPGFNSPATPLGWASIPGGLSWDPAILAANFNTMTLHPPQEWLMDIGAETHMTSNSGTLSSLSTPTTATPSSIVVGDGSILPVASTGSVSIPHSHGTFHLNNVLVSPHLLKKSHFRTSIHYRK